MVKSQYIVLAKKTMRSEWQVIFAIDKSEEDSYDKACEAWRKFDGYKCIVTESKFGSYITQKEVRTS